mgnify:CR=1 FL=1
MSNWRTLSSLYSTTYFFSYFFQLFVGAVWVCACVRTGLWPIELERTLTFIFLLFLLFFSFFPIFTALWIEQLCFALYCGIVICSTRRLHRCKSGILLIGAIESWLSIDNNNSNFYFNFYHHHHHHHNNNKMVKSRFSLLDVCAAARELSAEVEHMHLSNLYSVDKKTCVLSRIRILLANMQSFKLFSITN